MSKMPALRTLEPLEFERCVTTVRMLVADMVHVAGSGHPGTALGIAGVATRLWLSYLRHDPSDPAWDDRDRFVLSCGHASALLYSLLFLSGYPLSVDDLRAFRRYGSRTPGHPERTRTPGVEMTTGLLGQGLATAVGVSAGLKMRAASNATSSDDQLPRVFCIASDGDMMEGVSCEAASLAGHLGLNNLVVIYDANRTTCDGRLDICSSGDVVQEYRARRWCVEVVDGHDDADVSAALGRAIGVATGPRLIVAETRIGFGLPELEGTHVAHGAPIDAALLARMKAASSWPAAPFHVPADVHAAFVEHARAAVREQTVRKPLAYAARIPFPQRTDPGQLFTDLAAAIPERAAPTRAHSADVQRQIAARDPLLVGGSADLDSSTKTFMDGYDVLARARMTGRNIHFGVREHAMGAFVNGLSACGFTAFGATFLAFSDYMRPAIRIAALSGLGSIFVFTYDSLLVGEDGPTHQPVEHLWSLRLIPDLDVVRPCNAVETCFAWSHALARRSAPTAIVLTRQLVPFVPRCEDPLVVTRGAYVLHDSPLPSRATIVATGSEVPLALDSARLLERIGLGVRVVSAPCWEQFLRQPPEYRAAILPPRSMKVTLELGSTSPWRGIGDDVLAIGCDGFGASGSADEIRAATGTTPDVVTRTIVSWLRRNS